jgi:hypothetical protein
MLGFDWTVPKWRIGDAVRWHVLLPWHAALRANAIACATMAECLMKAACPPHYETMRDAVHAVAEQKFGPNGIYTDKALFDRIYKGDFGARYLKEASDYAADVIECTADICTYIHQTHRRFPAHSVAIRLPAHGYRPTTLTSPITSASFAAGSPTPIARTTTGGTANAATSAGG